MECDVIIPVGPGHERIYHDALESVRIATCLRRDRDRTGIVRDFGRFGQS